MSRPTALTATPSTAHVTAFERTDRRCGWWYIITFAGTASTYILKVKYGRARMMLRCGRALILSLRRRPAMHKRTGGRYNKWVYGRREPPPQTPPSRRRVHASVYGDLTREIWRSSEVVRPFWRILRTGPRNAHHTNTCFGSTFL